MTSQGRRQDINNDDKNVWEKEVMRRRRGKKRWVIVDRIREAVCGCIYVCD